MTQVGLCAFLIPLALSWTLTRLAIAVAPRFGLMDHPDPRKAHAKATPLGGGVALFASVCLTLGLVVFAAFAVRQFPALARMAPALVQVHADGVLASVPLILLIVAAAALQMIVGLIDDVRGLSAGVRLIIESMLVCVLMWQGVRLDILPGWDWVTYPLTLLWIVGLTNALNFLDNMDGLSAGVAGIASVFFACVAILVGDLFVGGCFVVLAGGVFGFLWWNWPPARIFMGDAGSNFLGFWIGVLSVIATFKTEAYSHVTLLAPLCIAAVPIYDTISVTILRLAQGRSPFQPDRQHLSHRLVDLGFSPRAAVLLIYLLTIATGLGGIALYFVHPMGAVFIVMQLVCTLGVIATIEFVAHNRSKTKPNEEPRIGNGDAG